MCDLYICRVCLNTDVRGYEMDEHNLRSYYEYIMRQRVNPKDGLPQWLCFECAMILHKFHKFKEKCFRGQLTLKQVSCRGKITYESVSIINRYSENLVSSVGVTMANKRVKTTNVKYRLKPKPKLMEVEKVMSSLDSEDSMKHDVIPVEENKHVFEKTAIDNEKQGEKVPVEKLDIKIETTAPLPLTESLKAEDNIPKDDHDTDYDDIGNTFDTGTTNNETVNANNATDNTNIPTENTNNIPANINDDGNTDHIDNAMSSEDDDIFLDVVKKAVTGENKLVKKKFNTENTNTKERKFARPKKEYFNPQYWRKFNLNEKDAMHDFKQREHSDKYVNANYKCHDCLKGFSKIEMLIRHVKLRHDESVGPIECRFCHMRFRLKNQLCKHINQHYAVYHCLRCDMRFRLESAAIFHEDYHNGVIRKCKHCGEEFKHSSTYYTHLRMSHRSAHVCTLCGASFVSEAGVHQHRRMKHFDNSDEPSTAADPHTQEIYCDKCDIKFLSRRAYNEHLSNSNNHGDATENIKAKDLTRGKIPTTCTHCGDKFPSRQAYKKHHLTDHSHIPFDNRTICEVCGVSLSAGSVAQHKITHSGERRFPCTLCDKRFTQKSNMKMHYKTVHLKQPYPKYPRRKPYRRKKKTKDIPHSDFTAFIRPEYYT